MRLSGRPFSQITRITGSFTARAWSIKLPGDPPSNHTRSGRPNGALFAGSAVRIDRDLSAGPLGVKMATSWWARLTRWPGVKHPKARGRAGTIALQLRESLARRAGVPACLPACLPGLAWSANRSIPRSDYRGAADTEFCMRLLFRSLSPRPIGFSIFAPCYRGETIIYPHLPLAFPLPSHPPSPLSLMTTV